MNLSSLLRECRLERRISQKQLADAAGVNPSVVHRAERGTDARLSTWNKLFEGLGYRLTFEAEETSEDAGGWHLDEAYRRRERSLVNLRTRG